jgi:hypothetical protein
MDEARGPEAATFWVCYNERASAWRHRSQGFSPSLSGGVVMSHGLGAGRVIGPVRPWVVVAVFLVFECGEV